MKLVGISGAQGQGKSTTINELAKQEGFIRSEVQTARSILTGWQLTLNEVNKYPPLKVRFQEELLRRHEQAITLNPVTKTLEHGIVLIERTFADIFVYAMVSLGAYNDYSDWLEDYYRRCAKAQEEHFEHVFYLTGRQNYTPEEDGVRSTNKFFASMVDHQIAYHSIKMGNCHYVDTPDLNERVQRIIDVCTNLK
jgi:predicted ATPase